MQREKATFERLSDLINYQQEAEVLACEAWAQRYKYELYGLELMEERVLLEKQIHKRHLDTTECDRQIKELEEEIKAAPIPFEWNQVSITEHGNAANLAVSPHFVRDSYGRGRRGDCDT